MVNSYLRYEKESAFGVVASNCKSVKYDKSGKYALVGALENVILWNIKQGTSVQMMLGPELVDPISNHSQLGQVVCLEVSPDYSTVAVGYSNGKIILFQVETGKLIVTFDGHRKSVECLSFNENGTLLVSGSKDTNIVVWDVVAETGMLRLKGHRDAVTCVGFLNQWNKVVSGSKDTLMKIWDLDTQCCVQTYVGHRSEIWSFDLNKDETRLISCTSDDLLRIFSIEKGELKNIGSLKRHLPHERGVQVMFNSTSSLFACLNNGKSIQVFKVRNADEMKKKRNRRLKRKREKMAKKQTNHAIEGGEADEQVDESAEADKVNAADELEDISIVRSDHKINCFAFSPLKDSDHVLLGLGNNSVEEHAVSMKKDESSVVVHEIGLPGHRSDIRAVDMSSDNLLLLTVSASLIKIWNIRSMQCVHTMSSNMALCGKFAPGNRHVIVGTKLGHLQIFDLQSGQCIMNDENAHDGAIWSIDVNPNELCIATGGADHQVKFWDFEMIAPGDDGKDVHVLSLVHTRTLKMADDVLCVRYSPSKDPLKVLVAVALLDCTVKVFFDDSLKFFISLYGHKLPVMSMDISSDSSMLVTASADKNVKLWGLDFGDCHKSIFAHDDSIMSVKFVDNTHYFFTASKDYTVKYWDADTFERILVLNGHFGQVWGLVVSSDGSLVVSVSHDRSIRKWCRTEDQVFLEEEREKEFEAEFESELNHKSTNDTESSLASKKTVLTVKGSERLIQALDLALAEQASIKQSKIDNTTHQPNMVLLGYTPIKYILYILRSIKSTEIEQTMLLLPFDYVTKLISFLLQLVQLHLEIEVCLNILLFILRIHHDQIVSNHSLQSQLDTMWQTLRPLLLSKRDQIGFNMAGLNYIQRSIDHDKSNFLQDDNPRPCKKLQV